MLADAGTVYASTDRLIVATSPWWMMWADGADDECGGRCLGMVGSSLVLEQGGIGFVVSLKEWESHEVEVLDGQVTCSFEAEPQQFSLF